MRGKMSAIVMVTLLITTSTIAAGFLNNGEKSEISFIEKIYEDSTDPNVNALDSQDQSQTQYDYSRNIGDSTGKLAQTFKPTYPTLTKFQIQLQKDSGPAEFASYWIKLYAGTPGGTVFNMYTTSISSSTISTGVNWYEIDISDQILSPGSTYFIEIYGTAPTIWTTNVRWCYGVTTAYTNGAAYYYSSSTWYLLNFFMNPCDYCFKTFGSGGGPNNPPNAPSQLQGPTYGNVDETLTYTSSAIDPDGDVIKFGYDFQSDGIVDGWSENYFPSGVTVTIYLTFDTAGTYHVSLKAKDLYGAESGFSPPKTIIIGDNDPPNTPTIPAGPSSGSIGTAYSYSTSAIDPDGDQVQYRFDWDAGGSHEYSGWTILDASGTIGSLSHSWSAAGTYEVKAQARDEFGAESTWSSALIVTISAGNNAPNKPDTPTGKINGKSGLTYTYETSTTDPDGDQVWYQWDWGDEVSDWDGPYASGDTATASHSWSNKGTFSVKVKAKDSSDLESVFSDPLSVSIPKNKIMNLFDVFLFNHPFLQQVLILLDLI